MGIINQNEAKKSIIPVDILRRCHPLLPAVIYDVASNVALRSDQMVECHVEMGWAS